VAECLVCKTDADKTGFVNLGGGPICLSCLGKIPEMVGQRLEDNLTFATTQQLIDELIRRTTFCGVVIWANGYKGEEIKKPDWRWAAKNCNPAGVAAQVAEVLGGTP
jgi:hypothetical protein